METKPYFHEIPQSEINDLIARKVTIGYILENYLQPDWCKYPEALTFDTGCWALCDLNPEGFRTDISETFCRYCPENKNYEFNVKKKKDGRKGK